jgi:hypothetical protein
MATHYENLSSNTLFHFTPKLEYLESILINTFQPRYSIEDLNLYKNKVLNKPMAYPMVCFCDIPLSKLKRHIGTYGNYGIGLKKSWGRRNNLSPVIYTRKGSKTALTFEHLINWNKSINQKLTIDEQKDFSRRFSEILMHTKPYYGSMNRNDKIIKRRFYDEREWRWIPELDPNLFQSHLIETDFERIQHFNSKIANHRKLKFSPNDIEYLILNNESEISEFIDILEMVKVGFDEKTVKKLTSRIITKDQIQKDF